MTQKTHEPYSGAPIHPISAVAIIALDLLWSASATAAAFTGIGILFVPFIICFTGTSGFFSTLFVQKFVARDSWGASFAKALAMSILAGIPTPVVGSAAGGALLVWAGVSAVTGRRETLPVEVIVPHLPPEN